MRNKSLCVMILILLAGLLQILFISVSQAANIDAFEVNQADECSVTISPESATVDCGNTIEFSAVTIGTGCETPAYTWSVTSTIGSTITEAGLYTAGDNGTGSSMTDIVRVIDTANGNATDSSTVTVRDCCLCCLPLSLVPAESAQGQTLQVALTAENAFKNVPKDEITVDFGEGITVNKINDKSNNTLKVEIMVDANAIVGTRTVLVTTPAECYEGTFKVTLGPTMVIIPPAGRAGGDKMDVTIIGQRTHFAKGKTKVKFGKNIEVNNVTVESKNRLTLKINIGSKAEVGVHNVTVTTDLGGGMEEVATTSFVVLPE